MEAGAVDLCSRVRVTGEPISTANTASQARGCQPIDLSAPPIAPFPSDRGRRRFLSGPVVTGSTRDNKYQGDHQLRRLTVTLPVCGGHFDLGT